jgi:hypothetical protein
LRRHEVALLQVVAPGDHLLGRELVARDVDLACRALTAYSVSGYLRMTSLSASSAVFGAALVVLDVRDFIEQRGGGDDIARKPRPGCRDAARR